MKCIYCGEELQEGSLFCSHCGKAAQIVPDYNVYDDDYLNQVLTEEQSESVQPQTKPQTESVPQDAVAKPPRNKKQQKKLQIKIIVSVIAIVCVLIFALLVLGAAIRSNHANSYDYQVEQAQKAYERGDLDSAIEAYENALALRPDDIEVRLLLAKLYREKKNDDAALVLYQEVLRKDKKNREAAKNLIAIYDERENMDAILALSTSLDDSLQDLFEEYLVTTPLFSLESGTYDAVQSVLLSSASGYQIYYTLDGSDPSIRGMVYTAPIELTENGKTYTIKAVCMNEKKIYSDVEERTYTINIPAPDMPIVTPDGGDFGAETNVTITVPDGCTAYYTWDGTTPNTGSTRYTGPFPIPEGNNVLAVIIIDNSTYLSSEVYKGNFVYYVDDYTQDDIDDDMPEDNE
jgi:tetratricopeptide (TPR) repeat protein